MLRARLTADTDTTFALQTPYHADLVAWLRTLPGGTRTWDPARKVWLIAAMYSDDVLATLQSFQFEVQDDRARTGLAPTLEGAALWAPPGMPEDLASALYQLGLNGEAPLELAEVAWRFWQKHYHEDVGGEFETSARLNDAIQTIRRYLKE